MNGQINAEAYRSGHNEAVLKTVWVQAHGGSNPSASATQSLVEFSLGFIFSKTKNAEAYFVQRTDEGCALGASPRGSCER